MRRLTVAALLLLCVACDHGHVEQAHESQRQRREAIGLIAANCGACHQVPGVAGAKGRVGPSLSGIARQQIIAGHFINTPENLTSWIEHPQSLLPGDAMPETGLNHEQVRTIVDYLYTME
jgi:cytochrome c